MIAKAVIENILADYDRNKSSYDTFARKVEHLVVELIGNAGFNPHTVTSRTKERANLHTKLQKEDSNYRTLADVTDVAGVRVTTYFHDDVDQIAKVLESAFEILPEYSVDKRQALDPDQFGYLSLHFVVRLSPARRALPEYQRFEKLRCEIQIRSILQHAWAEIEHDLGYKANVEVPKDIRRQFSRLAGLLELADQEFSRIRVDLAAYEKALPSKIKEQPSEVLLDKSSLTEFLISDGLAVEADAYIAKKFQVKVGSHSNSELLLGLLDSLNINSIAELRDALQAHEQIVKRFAAAWIEGRRGIEESVPRGIAIFYLVYVLLAKKHDRSFIMETLGRFSIGLSEERASNVDRMISVLAEIEGK